MKPCTAPDCDRKAKAKGLCQMHYMRLRQGGRSREEITQAVRARRAMETTAHEMELQAQAEKMDKHEYREQHHALIDAVICSMLERGYIGQGEGQGGDK